MTSLADRQAFHMQAFVDYVRFAAAQKDGIIDRFRAETGCAFVPGATPIDRMIDKATGRDREVVEAFVTWCAGQYGTEYLPPDYLAQMFGKEPT